MKKDKKYYGQIVTFTGGDLTELERSSVRKVMRTIKKNDTRAQDTNHKYILNKCILGKLKHMVRDTKFVGGVAGNHLIEFSQEGQGLGYANSEEYLIRRLGGEYCGEGKLLLNLHFDNGGHKTLKKVIITHGQKGGSKAAIINELQKIYYLYVKIDLVIKCHAHDPMAGFYCKYDLPDKADGKIKKAETLVMCLGSTRGGEVMGYDDYTERCNYAPHAARFPMAIFYSTRNKANSGNGDIKIRPIIM
jgi:hypothetical protein